MIGRSFVQPIGQSVNQSINQALVAFNKASKQTHFRTQNGEQQAKGWHSVQSIFSVDLNDRQEHGDKIVFNHNYTTSLTPVATYVQLPSLRHKRREQFDETSPTSRQSHPL